MSEHGTCRYFRNFGQLGKNDRTIGWKYAFVKDLGSGGFGKVFLAKEERSGNIVAVKQLKDKEKQRQDSILHELQIVSRFNHSNIVSYKHQFFQDDLLFIVMEYCALGSMRDIGRKTSISSTSIWKWMETLTETLQFVHEKGVIHHDIKPDNILFTEDSTMKISDFGVANTGGGTRPYMSPEALGWETGAVKDPRVDVYALGVTLLELLTKRNPFFGKSVEEIIEMHDTKDFGVTELPNWQQEIILKAIAKIPEQRFQSMGEFNEAIQARRVPIVFDKEVIQAGDLAEKAEQLLKQKKWQKAFSVLEYAERELKLNVNVLQCKGRYHLLQRQIPLAKAYYEKALKENPRLDVQKELGWINLELKNYPTAISLLSDHLHRNPSDFEAYNLLLQCYYETNRYEPAMDLARIILDIDYNMKCFANNYYICCALQNIGKTVFPETVLKVHKSENHFLNYNYSVILETEPSHGFSKRPTLKSKLIFMDYRFNKFTNSTLFCTGKMDGSNTMEMQMPIIKLGREQFADNDVKLVGGTSISRRHSVIVNSKDDVWIYDLDSTGTYVNGKKVLGKMPLVGNNVLRIGGSEYEVTNDRGKLF